MELNIIVIEEIIFYFQYKLHRHTDVSTKHGGSSICEVWRLQIQHNYTHPTIFDVDNLETNNRTVDDQRLRTVYKIELVRNR